MTAIFKFYKSETTKYIWINDSHFQIVYICNYQINTLFFNFRLFKINMAENIWFKYQHIITAIFKFYKSETTKYNLIDDSHFQIIYL